MGGCQRPEFPSKYADSEILGVGSTHILVTKFETHWFTAFQKHEQQFNTGFSKYEKKIKKQAAFNIENG